MSNRCVRTAPFTAKYRLGASLLLALGCAPVAPPNTAAAPGAAAAAPAPGTPAAAPPAGAPAPGAPAPGTAAPGTAAPGAPEDQDPKFDFDAMLAREKAASQRLPVVDPSGRWRGLIEGRRQPLVASKDGLVSVRTNFGAKSELRCEVHDGQLNPGATVANLLGAAAGAISLEAASVYRVGSAGGAPVLFVRALYETRDKPPLGGELKLAVSPGAQFSFVCLHDEPGFRESFARVVEGFVGSFEAREHTRAPQFATVWRQQVGEALTGYVWERIFAEPDGTLTSFTFDVMVAQLATGELRVSDDLAVELHDARGVRHANYLGLRGTSRTHEIALERGDGGSYGITGTADGKPVQGKLQPRTPIASQYELLLALGKSKAAPGKVSFRQEEYRPRPDALKVESAEYTFDAAAGTLTRTSGTKVEGYTVANGVPVGSRVQVGPNTFVGTVVSQHDALGRQPGVTFGMQPAPAAGKVLPLAEQRRNFETKVFSETSHTPAPTPPAGVLSKVTYPAPLGANVAYVTPERKGTKRPGVVWIGSGLDWSIGESAWAKAPREADRSARAFRDAGLALMLPALRGSNENPGKNECFLGEVEDVLAAADYLATREDVDPTRIYLAGHATGGTLALLAAATSERFSAVFAFGPVNSASDYGTPGGGGCLPPDATADEVMLRAPINYVGSIRTPTFVFEGGLNGNADVFDELRERSSPNLHFTVVPGVDATNLLAPATEVIARAIATGHVDDEHLQVDVKAPAKKP